MARAVVVLTNFSLYLSLNVDQFLSFCLNILSLNFQIKEEKKNTIHWQSLSRKIYLFPLELSTSWDQKVFIRRQSFEIKRVDAKITLALVHMKFSSFCEKESWCALSKTSARGSKFLWMSMKLTLSLTGVVAIFAAV